MSSIMKLFLLLAVTVCISEAQVYNQQQCLCQRVRMLMNAKSEIKDIQIHPATFVCDKVEIVVTLNSGLRYCLNPELKVVKKLMTNILRKQTTTTVRPSQSTSAPGSTTTARIWLSL